MEMDFENGIKAVREFVERTQEMDFDMFLSTVAMTLEERCKIEGADMVSVCEKLWLAAQFVNETEGRY